RADGLWSDVHGTNVLDLAAPFYNVYETADGGYITVGGGEPQFYAELVTRIGADEDLLERQHHEAAWPEDRDRMTAIFKTRTRDDCCAVLEATGTCFVPVLTLDEAPRHRHNAARGTFVEVGGVVQPAPAPRFSRTPGAVSRPPAPPGEHTTEALTGWGSTEDEVRTLQAPGVVAQAAHQPARIAAVAEDSARAAGRSR